jgi:hypothetical protein
MNVVDDGALESEAYDIVEPYAPAMIESLRAVGYDLSTAVADLVDNSLTAGGIEIDVIFFWNGEASSIAVIDNGSGMSEEQLIEALRIGADPTLPRPIATEPTAEKPDGSVPPPFEI